MMKRKESRGNVNFIQIIVMWVCTGKIVRISREIFLFNNKFPDTAVEIVWSNKLMKIGIELEKNFEKNLPRTVLNSPGCEVSLQLEESFFV